MAFDTSGFGLNLGQEQTLVPTLANLAPYAPDFRGLAWKPADIKAPVVVDNSVIGKAIGSALGEVGKGISVAYKSAQDEKKELRKDALDRAKLAATERRDATKEARADLRQQQSLGMQGAHLAIAQGQLDLARQKQEGTGADYSEYVDKGEYKDVNDHVSSVLEGVKQEEMPPVYFPKSNLELGAPAPQVDEPGMSFDGQNNLGSLSAPVAMPPQEDQRYASLRNLSETAPQFSVASANGAGMQAPTLELPYSLQGGVPRALTNVQVPSTKELYAPQGGGFTPTPMPTYASAPAEPAPARQAPRTAITQLPVSDTQGNIIGAYNYDKVTKKLIPGSFTKVGTEPLAQTEPPVGYRVKSMSVNPKGEKSYTYETKNAELSEGQARLLNSLGDDYKSDPFIKNANEAVASQSIVQGSLNQQNGFGDIAAINAMQRMIDPGVAVREGDVTLMQQAIPRLERWGLKTKNLVIGDQLTPAVRLEMSKLADELVDQRASIANEKAIPKFKRKAEKIGLDFDLIGEEFAVKSKKLQKQFSTAKKELDSLAQEIDSAKDQNSPDILSKKKRAEALYLSLKK